MLPVLLFNLYKKFEEQKYLAETKNGGTSES